MFESGISTFTFLLPQDLLKFCVITALTHEICMDDFKVKDGTALRYKLKKRL